MKFDNFTLKAKESLVGAQNIAKKRNHQQMTPEHVLYALLDNTEGISVAALKKIGIDPATVAADLDRVLNKIVTVQGQPDVYFTQDALNALQLAVKISKDSGETEVAQDHILLGLFYNEGSNLASSPLKNLGVKRQALLEAIVILRRNVASGSTNGSRPLLDRFARDLTLLAKLGKLDPIIGRDDEMRRVMQILSRKTKNNPILVGPAGVGKSALIEGIAQRIASGDVPLQLKGKKLVSLDMASLIAGAKLRGEFEERVKGIIKEIQEAKGEILLYIDEIHTMASGKGEGSSDVSSMLKPALARGELRCIGSTTPAEYRSSIEKDVSLARRFQAVKIEQPTVDQTIAILRGVKEKYELHHGVKITDAALIAAAQLSARYIQDRNLPDKAIDLIDEAASQLRITIDSVPPEIDNMDREVMQWNIELKALEKETDADSRNRKSDLMKKISVTKAKSESARNKWENEIKTLQMIQDAKERLDVAKHAEKEFERVGDYGKAAEFKFGKIPVLEKSLNLAENSLKELQKSDETARLLSVTAEDIAKVVEQATGIPTNKMLASEMQKLVKMEEVLKLKVVGQDEAVKAISDSVRLARAGLQDANKPIGSFMFLGSTGTGKTQVAKTLAEYLFDDEAAMIRFDMSEFMEKHNATRLIGAPPGYQGADEGGQLTEAVRRRPYSVVLFDEIEKAHPDVFNLLLQLLDDGRLTDSKGTTVDFTNTVIIMTSNVGSKDILELGPDQKEEAKKRVLAALAAGFKPELLNRVDKKIVFNMLTKTQLVSILTILLKGLQKRIADRNITLNLTQAAKNLIIEAGNEPALGARPLKRAVLSLIQEPLSLRLLSGDFNNGDEVIIDVAENGTELVFTKAAK